MLDPFRGLESFPPFSVFFVFPGKGFFDRGRAHKKSVIHILLVDLRGVRGVEVKGVDV